MAGIKNFSSTDVRVVVFILVLQVICLREGFTAGISLRRLARKILKFFKTRVSYRTIHRWIKAFQKTTPVVNTGSVWHADETIIWIKGKIHWLWLVMDRMTRTIITYHLSRTRKYNDAKLVIQKAAAKKKENQTC